MLRTPAFLLGGDLTSITRLQPDWSHPMSDDPLNALVAELLAEADLLGFDDKIILRLDSGISLVHNPGACVVRDGAERIRPGSTLIRLHDLPVGVVTPWRWTLTIADDRLRYALLRALARLRDGLPLAAH